jgi:predicted ribonuclease YlaK
MMIATELIVLTTDSNMRGINFEKVGLILDEAENCDHETLKLIFTRCHDNCHVIMLGDSKQKDNRGNNTEFISYGNYLADASFGNKCMLTKNYRGKFSQYAENFGV